MIKLDVFRYLLSIPILIIALAACTGQAITPLPSSAPISPLASAMTSTSTIDSATSLPAATDSQDVVSKYQPTIAFPPDLHLSGKLIMAGFNLGITRFDFSSEKSTQVFQPVENSYVGDALLSPDGQTYLMVYSPPREPKDPLYGTSGLYTLPVSGAGDPSPLLKVDANHNSYFSLAWSPDSQFIYYGRHYNPPAGTPTKRTSGYFLSRYTLPNGPAQDLLRDVLALDLSSDGQKMFYISGNLYGGMNNLYLANSDGSRSNNLLPGGASWIIDSLAVSPDDQTIVFSSSEDAPIQTTSSWFDQLMGVSVAQAHNVPSDLFIMKIGEPVRQLTRLREVGFIEAFSPDGQWIVFSCSKGVYVIHPDGSEQTMIMSDPVYGTIQWLP